MNYYDSATKQMSCLGCRGQSPWFDHGDGPIGPLWQLWSQRGPWQKNTERSSTTSQAWKDARRVFQNGQRDFSMRSQNDDSLADKVGAVREKGRIAQGLVDIDD